MAVVGSAYVVVRAITDKVDGDIRKAFSGATKSASRAGKDMGNGLFRGLNDSAKTNKFTALRDQLRELYPEAENASKSFTSLVRRGYLLQGALGAIAGSIGAAVGGLGALIGSALAAAPALLAVASAAATLKIASGVAKFSLGGIGAAVKNATKPTSSLGTSVRALTEEYEDLLWAAEDAALGVDRAGINLEKAREALLRSQDMPQNSRSRRETELAFREAEFAYRKALKNQEDLNEEAEKGVQNSKGGGGGAAEDPFAGLTASQREFAEFLVKIQPLQDKLKEAAASGFLPILQTQLSRLLGAGLFETLETNFRDIGEAAGIAFAKFNDVFLGVDGIQKLDRVLKDVAEKAPSFGTIFGNIFDSLLTVLIAVEPLTRRFVDYLETKSNSIASFLDIKQSSGELESFFQSAGDAAAKLGSIFGNIFGGVANIVQANFSPGSGGWAILDWLDEITQAWQDADDIFLNSYFEGAADNFIAIGDAIGGAVETLIRIGADPAVGQFWETLDSGSYEFQQLMQAAARTAPALGEVMQTITSIVSSLADSSVPTTFFETLNFFLEGIDQMMIALKPIFDSFIGQAMAIGSALGLVFLMLTNIGTIGVGFVTRLAASLGMVAPAAVVSNVALTGVAVTAKATGAAVVASMAPLAPIIAAIAAVFLVVTAVVAIKGNQMESAVKGVTTGFENAKSASDIWGEATKANSGYYANSIKDLDTMKENMNRLSLAQKEWHYSTFKTTAIADSFGAIGRALADVAVTDLPKAQEQFKSFTDEVGFSNEEIVTALNEMDEYKTALTEQADQMDINIRTTDGQIDMQKLANFAIGEGEIAVRRHKKEMSEAAIESGELARAEKIRIQGLIDSFIDYEDGLNQNKDELKIWAEKQAEITTDAGDTWKDYYDDQKFNLDLYLEGLEAQITAQKEWQSNLAELAPKVSTTLLNALRDLGEDGAPLISSLTEATETELSRLETLMGEAGFDTATAFKDGVTKGLTNFNLNNVPGFNVREFKGLTPVPRKDGGYISQFALGGFVSGAGTARSDSIPAMLSNGEFVVNARATAQNRALLESINSNNSVSNRPSVQITVNPSAGMDERELAEAVSRRIAFEIRRGNI